MISVVLLLKIIGIIGFVASWVFMYRKLRRAEVRLVVLAEAIAQKGDCGEAEKGALEAEQRKALEAEQRFSEGIANILNYSVSTAETAHGGDADGRKGEP